LSVLLGTAASSVVLISVHAPVLETFSAIFDGAVGSWSALAKDPKNRELRTELKELRKYYEFLQKVFERNARHTALRQSRRALEPKPVDKDGKSDMRPY
jgi:hypothetical protein